MGKKLVFSAFFVLALCTTVGAAVSGDEQYKESDFRRITSMTARILDKNHYSGVPMDAKLSNRIFDLYFDALDPQHIFFTEQDIKHFLPWRDTLGTKLQEGKFEFAFLVYNVYRRRYAEFRKFTKEMLDKPVDFTVNEEIPAELSKQPRPANRKDMLELWRKYLKSELLSIRLNDRISAEESKNDTENKNPDAANTAKRKDPVQRIMQRQRDTGNNIDKRDRIDILGLLLDAMAQAYGAHSDYQAPKLSEDFEIQMSLSLTGIGATLSNEDGYVKIVELVPGGPADLSGKLKVGDRIVSVTQENGDFTDLVDMPVSKAVQFIRGEKGSKVTLDIVSGTSSAPSKVTIVRDKINLSAGAAKSEIREVNGIKVGIIMLPAFYMDFDAAMRGDADARKASTDVLAILNEFKKKSVQSVVIDLRGNGGGSLPDAITLSGLFMRGGPVVQVRTKDDLELQRDPSPEVSYDGPLVILTSKFSASAAEIFTGALTDAKRAVVVGDSRTFGKGTVLRVESLDRYNSWFNNNVPAGSLTFEMAMFFRPGGNSVQQLGIAPDILLPSLTEEMQVGEIYLDNHLPWDAIAPVQENIWDKNLDKKIAILKEKSAERIAADKNYQAFIKQIELFRELRERKTVSLQEDVRYNDYRKEKEISEEAEKLLNDDSGKDKGGDVVLKEAVNIAADLSVIK